MQVTSSGRIVIWQGGSLWIGETRATTGLHDHHAIQITMALQGGSASVIPRTRTSARA